MFYPKCPECGGKTTAYIEDEDTERRWRMAPHAMGSAIHPAAGIAASVANAARTVAKRTSLMKKECTECGNIFY